MLIEKLEKLILKIKFVVAMVPKLYKMLVKRNRQKISAHIIYGTEDNQLLYFRKELLEICILCYDLRPALLDLIWTSK